MIPSRAATGGVLATRSAAALTWQAPHCWRAPDSAPIEIPFRVDDSQDISPLTVSLRNGNVNNSPFNSDWLTDRKPIAFANVWFYANRAATTMSPVILPPCAGKLLNHLGVHEDL